MNDTPDESFSETTSDAEMFLKVSADLFNDVNPSDHFPAKTPLIAHYTSLATLEKIVKNDEIWFSNPLYMNDVEEIRFGMNESLSAFRMHKGIADACVTDRRREMLHERVLRWYAQFEQVHDFDTYVFCCSEHNPQDNDGLLSMWRGYGGDGTGAAIVLDSQQVDFRPSSPMTLTPVSYGSRGERRAWIQKKLDEFERILRSTEIPDIQLQAAATALVGRFRIFALSTKHRGFSEEKEWRFVYAKQMDVRNVFTPMLDYALSPKGIEQKLKLKLQTTEDHPNLSISALTNRIILGPTLSGAMSVEGVKRMLSKAGKDYLTTRIVASGTPYRSVRG